MPIISTKGAASSQGVGEFNYKKAASAYIEDVFSTYIYTGNGSTQTITNGIDLSGKGGLVWVKKRNAAESHFLVDSARGAFRLETDNTGAQASQSLLTLASSGFNLLAGNAAVNGSSSTYASWTFRKAEKFFDVVTYTGNGTFGRAIAHNLGSTPGCIIVKCTSDGTLGWRVYHRSLTSPNTLALNTTDAQVSDNGYFSSTAPTSTNFYVGDSGWTNGNGKSYVAYLFAHDAGGFGNSGSDNVISCGSYTTDGSGNADITLGYEPQWFLTKITNTTGNWAIRDNMRGWNANSGSSTSSTLLANSSAAESSGGGGYGVTSTGIQARGINTNATFIYIAIRRGPMKTPTSGTSIFNAISTTTNMTVGNTFNFNFPADAFFGRGLSVGNGNSLTPRLTTKTSFTDSTGAELGTTYFNFNSAQNLVNVAATFDNDTDNYIYWGFRRAPSFMDVVCYTGNSSSANVTQSVTHNLGVVPELIIIKGRTTTDAAWLVGYNFTPSQFDNGYLYLTNASNPIGYNIAFFGAAPTSTTFSVTNQIASNPYVNNSNWSGNNYVAYLFATCSGVSKVGSYTGTGTTQQINCGFTGGARFVLIKRTDFTGDWYVWDSARGIVAGNDPYLLLNSTAAEVTNTDYVDTYSAGFEISSTAPAAINANGGTFIFLAIA